MFRVGESDDGRLGVEEGLLSGGSGGHEVVILLRLQYVLEIQVAVR